MFEELPAAGHVVAVRFSGMLTGDDIRRYRGILAGRLARHEHVSSWVDCTAMADVNAAALGEG